ncbi:MAG: hypothetical protein OEL66_10145, partial [Desulfobulbaceae bacterium]|nr:hypothetical protein [Desulfobulbaceae bacterium]
MKSLLNSFAIFTVATVFVLVGTGCCYSDEFTYHPGFKGIIDSHEHYVDGGDMEQFLRTATSLGIDKTVFLPTGTNCDPEEDEENMKSLLQLQKKYPDKI